MYRHCMSVRNERYKALVPLPEFKKTVPHYAYVLYFAVFIS